MTDDEIVRRTRKMMMARPELVEHITYNRWLSNRGAPNTEVERRAFDDLSEKRKGELRVEAWEACEAHWAMSAEERRAEGVKARNEMFARNDAEWQVNILPDIRQKLRNAGVDLDENGCVVVPDGDA